MEIENRRGREGLSFPLATVKVTKKAWRKKWKVCEEESSLLLNEKLDRACRNAIFRRIHLVETFLPWEKIQSNPEGEEGRWGREGDEENEREGERTRAGETERGDENTHGTELVAKQKGGGRGRGTKTYENL